MHDPYEPDPNLPPKAFPMMWVATMEVYPITANLQLEKFLRSQDHDRANPVVNHQQEAWGRNEHEARRAVIDCNHLNGWCVKNLTMKAG